MAGKVGAQVSRLRGEPLGTPPPRAEVGGPLDAINDQFHEAYEETRTQARREVPIFVVLADELLLFHRGKRSAWSFSPRAFHVIKSVAHAPLAIYAALERVDGGELDARTREQLGSQRERLSASLGRLERDASDQLVSTREDLRIVLQACLDFLDTLGSGNAPDARESFARALGPVLLRLIDAATQLQLDALHAHVEAALPALTPDELARLQVVVAGDHQARARSLGMQYFQKRLSEPQDSEQRVTYGEAVSSEQEALALVGTRRLDRALGRAFFDNEQRLQRDLLGDSACSRLEAAELTPIA